jgi:hypothetical protein
MQASVMLARGVPSPEAFREATDIADHVEPYAITFATSGEARLSGMGWYMPGIRFVFLSGMRQVNTQDVVLTEAQMNGLRVNIADTVTYALDQVERARTANR